MAADDDGRYELRFISHNLADGRYELRFVSDSGPAEGTPALSELISLIGPLRREAARRANGRLTQQLWKHLDEFRAAFEALGMTEVDGQEYM